MSLEFGGSIESTPEIQQLTYLKDQINTQNNIEVKPGDSIARILLRLNPFQLESKDLNSIIWRNFLNIKNTQGDKLDLKLTDKVLFNGTDTITVMRNNTLISEFNIFNTIKHSDRKKFNVVNPNTPVTAEVYQKPNSHDAVKLLGGNIDNQNIACESISHIEEVKSIVSQLKNGESLNFTLGNTPVVKFTLEFPTLWLYNYLAPDRKKAIPFMVDGKLEGKRINEGISQLDQCVKEKQGKTLMEYLALNKDSVSDQERDQLIDVYNSTTQKAVKTVTREKVIGVLEIDPIPEKVLEYSYQDYKIMSTNERFNTFTQSLDESTYEFSIKDKQIEKKCSLNEMIPSDINGFRLINGGKSEIVYRNSPESNFKYLDRQTGNPYVLNNTQIELISQDELLVLLEEKKSPLERYESMSKEKRFETYTHKDENGYLEFSFPDKKVEYRAKLNEIIPDDINIMLLHDGGIHDVLLRNNSGDLVYENPFMEGQNPKIFNGTRLRILSQEEFNQIAEQREQSYDIAQGLASFIDGHNLKNNGGGNCGMNIRPVVEKYLGIDVPDNGMHGYKWAEFLDTLVGEGLMNKEYVGNPVNAKPGALLCYDQMNTGAENQTNREKYGHIEIKGQERETIFYDKNGKPYTQLASHYYHGPYSKTPGGSIDARWQDSGFTGYAYYPNVKYDTSTLAQLIQSKRA